MTVYYIYGIDRRRDANEQSRNRRRCARCDFRDIERKRRCYGCPSKGNKPIVLSSSDQPRPSEDKI